jgi:hypothetical protein
MNVLKMFGTYDFSAPVNQPQGVMVDLAQSLPAPPEVVKKVAVATKVAEDTPEEESAVIPPLSDQDEGVVEDPEIQETLRSIKTAPVDAKPSNPVAPKAGTPKATPALGAPALAQGVKASPGSQFPSAKYEKLTYVISMLGLSIGTAELESKNEGRVTTITLRVRSNAAISAVFPVDDVVETSQIDGKYIVTKIKQQEGSFRSDEMFTINSRKQIVSWMDMIRHCRLTTKVPTDDVLDTLSGIYSLRNRHLIVGKTETLQIYDSEVYAEVPVEILSSEEMRLPNLTKVKTLVVRPLQKTAGIFRRTGEVLIWMTDDEFKVPVKIVTSVAIGKVTAELVSAESKPHEEAPVKKAADSH